MKDADGGCCLLAVVAGILAALVALNGVWWTVDGVTHHLRLGWG